MSKFEKLSERVQIQCEIIDLQIKLRYMDIDQNYDQDGDIIQQEEDIMLEIEKLSQSRDELKKTLQFGCKCKYERIKKEESSSISSICSNCLKLHKVTTFTQC
jgi:hypothetical protein